MVQYELFALKCTALYKTHLDLNARWTSFAGWQMPLFYSGVIQEHLAVRNSAGLFDLSHMGLIEIIGPGTADFLEFLSTNKIKRLPGSATYTVFCDAEGFAIDDTIVYHESENKAFIVANASNRIKDFNHLEKHKNKFNIKISQNWENEIILAVQGPKASAIIAHFFPSAEKLPFMHFSSESFLNAPLIISRTGYTGSGGFEIFAPSTIAEKLWSELFEVGKNFGMVPVGLGARDTLRLEAGFALYGHELNEKIRPIESVSAWTVHLDKDFLGKQALVDFSHNPSIRMALAFVLEGKAIAREGASLYINEEKCGYVTSGTYSPILKAPIALALAEKKYVDKGLENEQMYYIDVRDQKISSKRVKLPFIPLKS